jgi:hypothetical protein
MHRAINPVMRRVLAGRFHRTMGSDTLMVLDFQGRRTGRPFSFPIGYMQVDDSLVCYTPFGWWRNLRGGVPVSVTLRGRTLDGRADVCTDTTEITQGMAAYLRHNPGDARFFRVSLDDARQPNLEDVARAAKSNIQILIELD